MGMKEMAGLATSDELGLEEVAGPVVLEAELLRVEGKKAQEAEGNHELAWG